jgi:hypothetical protein
MSRIDQPGSGDVSQGVEPSCPVEKETGNQEAEVKNGVGALELYRPESQMSESAPDTLGIVNSGRIGGGGGIACSIRGSSPSHSLQPLGLLVTSETMILCFAY